MDLEYYIRLVKRKYFLEYKKATEYKVNFVLFFLTFLLDVGFILVFWNVIFMNSSEINGWMYQDIVGILLFIYLFWIMINLLEGGFERAFKSMRFGEFDSLLFYPSSPLFNLIFYRVNMTALLVNIGLFLIIFSYYLVNFDVESVNLLLGFVVALLGNLIIICFFFILHASAFWLSSTKYVENFGFVIMNLMKYPLTLSSKGFQLIFTFLFPIIFMVTIPAEFVRGNFEWKWIWYELFMFGFLLLLAKLLWRKGLARYESGMG